MFIYLFFINILFSQQELKIEGYDHMPLHTKLLWGKSGLFRKLNLAPDNRKDELKLRVRMLQTHQKLALASLGLVAYQSNLGNKMLDGDYSYYEDHKKFSRIAWVTYMTSASLSYFAPPALKYEKKNKLYENSSSAVICAFDRNDGCSYFRRKYCKFF